jgi:hypothetical protein
MDPLNKANKYSIFPIDFSPIEHLCIKGRQYSEIYDESDNCGVEYNKSSNIFDYIYYSEKNDELEYKFFYFRGIDNLGKKGIKCYVKIKVCSIECAECDDTFTNCIKCANGYHQLIETKNYPSFKC